MWREFAKYLGILLLLFPASASAVFYYLEEGLVFVMKDAISYRLDADKDSRFESVFAETEGRTAQRDKPFKGTEEPVRLWAKFDLPPVTAARRVMLGKLQAKGKGEIDMYFVLRELIPADVMQTAG